MRYMLPHEADIKGFGSLFTIAQNCTVMAAMLGNDADAIFNDYCDGVNSPFPKSHDGGILHHVWVSGCKHGLTTINGKAEVMERVQIAVGNAIRGIEHHTPHP